MSQQPNKHQKLASQRMQRSTVHSVKTPRNAKRSQTQQPQS